MGIFDLFKPAWQNTNEKKALNSIQKECEFERLSLIEKSAPIESVRLLASNRLKSLNKIAELNSNLLLSNYQQLKSDWFSNIKDVEVGKAVVIKGKYHYNLLGDKKKFTPNVGSYNLLTDMSAAIPDEYRPSKSKNAEFVILIEHGYHAMGHYTNGSIADWQKITLVLVHRPSMKLVHDFLLFGGEPPQRVEIKNPSLMNPNYPAHFSGSSVSDRTVSSKILRLLGTIDKLSNKRK